MLDMDNSLIQWLEWLLSCDDIDKFQVQARPHNIAIKGIFNIPLFHHFVEGL